MKLLAIMEFIFKSKQLLNLIFPFSLEGTAAKVRILTGIMSVCYRVFIHESGLFMNKKRS